MRKRIRVNSRLHGSKVVIKPLKNTGEVHGITNTAGFTQPDEIAPYAINELNAGIKIHGKKNIGLKIIGIPNIIGSLILKILGGNERLAIFFCCGVFEKNSKATNIAS